MHEYDTFYIKKNIYELIVREILILINIITAKSKNK
jgi:hypothetical protein